MAKVNLGQTRLRYVSESCNLLESTGKLRYEGAFCME